MITEPTPFPSLDVSTSPKSSCWHTKYGIDGIDVVARRLSTGLEGGGLETLLALKSRVAEISKLHT